MNGLNLEEIFPYPLSPDIFLSGNYLVLDFETTSIDKGDPRNEDNEVILASWKVYKDDKLVANRTFGGKDRGLSILQEDLEQVDFFVAHNTKFEYGWLRRIGVDIGTKLAYCTMIGEYVLAGNRPIRIGLDATADRRNMGAKDNLVSILIKGGVCPSTIPANLLNRYCEQDVDLCRDIFLEQRKELYDNKLLPVMFTRCIATPVLVDIESRGMHLDTDKVIQENITYEEKYNSISKQISEFTGSINLNSPKQVAELLYDRLGFSELTDKRGNPLRTAANNRRTDEATIDSLKGSNKSQRRFLELFKERAKLNAALTKNLHFFRAVVTETDDNIFYGNLNQTVTQTHRLSSTSQKVAFKLFNGKKKGIQMQNIPRAFKGLFTPRKKGWKINERDASQLEFRVAAFLGQDTVAMQDIRDKVDVHNFTSNALTEAGEPTDRQDAKSRTFKPLYGGLSGTKAERAYFDKFRKKYYGITNEQNRWKDTVERTKKLRIASGLIFYWPDTKISSTGYLKNTTSICNFPVQSFATADIIPIAVTIMWYMIRANNLLSFIMNTIHDSIISEVKDDEIEIYDEIGELSFNTGVKEYLKRVYKIDFNVDLDSESKTSEYWNG